MFHHIHLYASLSCHALHRGFCERRKIKFLGDGFRSLFHIFGGLHGEEYGFFSVSKLAENSVVRYIRNQENHHGKRTFKQELLTLLEKHEIKYDERYLWD